MGMVGLLRLMDGRGELVLRVTRQRREALWPAGAAPHEKWPRLFEQLSPIYKWTLGGLPKVQSCPRRRASLATNAEPRWATRGAPGISFYAASSSLGSKFK